MLGRAIDSVLNQTYGDLELIVVDDASTDDTSEVLSAIDDPRLVRIRLDQRRGAAVARNTGIRRTQGELVAFQDSDDLWVPTKLAHQLDALLSHGPSVGAIGGRYRVGDGTAAISVSAPHLESGSGYEGDLLDGHCLITPVWVVRRSLLETLGLFDEQMPCLEDWDLLLRLSQLTMLRAVPETVLIKYGAPDSLGGNPDYRGPGMEALLKRHGPRFLAHPRRHASFCLELAYLSVLRGRWLAGLRYAARSLRRRGATVRMLRTFVVVSFRAAVLDRVEWPVPGLAGD
jgi:glycosyltransferase involved in cell wall biosynthesis